MVLKGQVSLERQWNTEGKEAAERVYDPLWANALTFLDYLEDRNLVERQITRVRIGQFVLASGCLSILDLGTLKGMWDLPSVRKLLEAGAQNEQGMDQNRHERRRQHLERRTTDKDSLPPTAQIGLDLITRLPHAIQARLTSDETSIWCSLPENNLTVQSSDLALKHGSIIPGVWHMLGILDALPDGSEAAVKPQSLFEPIVNIMEQLAPLTRQLLGRPPQAYGMTPLLIFRAVTG
jgi:hypothetical protein